MLKSDTLIHKETRTVLAVISESAAQNCTTARKGHLPKGTDKSSKTTQIVCQKKKLCLCILCISCNTTLDASQLSGIPGTICDVESCRNIPTSKQPLKMLK